MNELLFSTGKAIVKLGILTACSCLMNYAVKQTSNDTLELSAQVVRRCKNDYVEHKLSRAN